MEKLKASGHAPINGIQMYYEIHGEGGIPLVLIHGGGSTIESSWANMLPLLSAHGQVIAVEMQAHGRTTDRNAPESFEQDADDAAALVKYLGIVKANFFGFSNGGTTTLQIAIRHPRVVNKIVDLAGASSRDGFFEGFFDGFAGATLDNMPSQLKNAFLKVTPDESLLLNMFRKDVQRMENFRDIPENDIKAIKTPALIMVNDRDVVPVEHAVKLGRIIPEGRLAILPGVHGECIGEATTGKTDKMITITAALIEEFLNS
ncbi:MAG TPA: alpha/beta hydrolase [Mucilaginibacter sp.]|jgi:pimeloyl-ACP methyl ester carboxylesterase|nr:alpha/beta hydrolase [Mucilaginibacter sp.]